MRLKSKDRTRTVALPFTAGDPYALCYAENGSPAWPIASLLDLLHLARASASHGGGVRRAKLVRPGYPSSSAGTVVSLGEIALNPGRLYAHLTGREHLPLENPADLSALKPDVVVADARSISYALLESLYEPSEAHAPGLILDLTEEALRRQVLARSAAIALPPRQLSTSVHYENGLSMESLTMSGGEVYGRRIDFTNLPRFDGRDLAVVTTHSDGIDAPLSNKILCALTDQSSITLGATPPPCLRADFCHRLQMPLQRAFASGHLLSPGILSARVVLLRICFGFLPSGALHDFHYGLLRAIVEHPVVGAVITSWNVTFAELEGTLTLIAMLNSGIPLGAAVATFNSSAIARRTGDRLCLMGDPEFRFEAPSKKRRASSGAKSGAKPERSASRNPDTAVRLGFLKAFLGWSHDQLRSADRDKFRRAAARIRPSAGVQLSDRTRRHLVELIAEGFVISCKPWSGHARPCRTERNKEPCLYCGQIAAQIKFTIACPDALLRRLLNCPRCGIVEDAEAASPPLRIEQRGEHGIFVSFAKRRDAWAAALRVEYLDNSRKSVFYLQGPSGDGNDLEFTLPEPLDPTATSLTVFLIDGERFSSARAPVKSQA